MAAYYVSLGRNEDVWIPAGGAYTLLDFPLTYSDDHGMRTDDGYTITPAVSGVGFLELNIHWEAGDYTKLRDVFTRDPYGTLFDPAGHDDRTAYDHRPPNGSGLMSAFTKMHMIKVNPSTPLGVYVSQNDSVARRVTHAQFKLCILSDVAQKTL